MLKTYLIVAFRNLRKHFVFSFVNVFGLAVGMACCLLILLFVREELSYDRAYPHADRIYRVITQAPRVIDQKRHEVTSSSRNPWTYTPVADVLTETIPEVEAAARFSRSYEPKLVVRGAARFNETRFFFADSSVFDLFGFTLAEGDARSALRQPFSVVLTRQMAKKYFGDEDPLGQALQVDHDFTYQVTGVLAPIEAKTHLDFDFLASFSTKASLGQDLTKWMGENSGGFAFTYFRVRVGTDVAALEGRLSGVLADRMGDGAFGWAHSFSIQPLPDIHFSTGFDGEDLSAHGDIRYLYLFSLVALLILVVACINYMNLATARAVQRAREVGVRKVLGARRAQLVGQFIGEAVLFSLAALVIAMALLEIAAPLFSNFVHVDVGARIASEPMLALACLGVALVVGLFAGSYPALFLSRFRPALVLKGAAATARGRSVSLRKALVVFQFTVSIALIACTAIIQRQLYYVQEERLGFEKDQVLVIDTQDAVGDRYGAFKEALLQDPGIERVTTSSFLPNRGGGGITVVSGYNFEGATNDELVVMEFSRVDEDFLETLGMRLVAGRNFSTDRPADVGGAVILNEAAARRLGLPPEKVVGTNVDKREVIGVVEDFHFTSSHEAVKPYVLWMTQSASEYVAARVRTGNLRKTIDAARATWDHLVPQQPFTYSFLDDDFATLYRAEQRVAKIFSAFSFLSVLIACLGLFGLAAFTAEQRTKEIGVRKVLGASVAQVVLLLSRDFVKLVVVAFVLATPVAYLAMDRWLQDFVYRVHLGAGVFALAGAAAVLVALLTVSYQSIRAARADPVKSLRYE